MLFNNISDAQMRIDKFPAKTLWLKTRYVMKRER